MLAYFCTSLIANCNANFPAVMKRLDAIDKNTSETKGMVGQLLMAKVQEYVDASSTGTGASQQKTFKAAVAAHYGYEDVMTKQSSTSAW